MQSTSFPPTMMMNMVRLLWGHIFFFFFSCDVCKGKHFIWKCCRSAYTIFHNEYNIYIVMKALITATQWNRSVWGCLAYWKIEKKNTFPRWFSAYSFIVCADACSQFCRVFVWNSLAFFSKRLKNREHFFALTNFPRSFLLFIKHRHSCSENLWI